MSRPQPTRATPTGLATTPGTRPPEAALLPVVLAATTLVLLTFTTVTITIQPAAREFHASVEGRTWAMSGVSLGLAAALLTAGSLADILGHRRVLRLSLFALVIASLAAATAPALVWFVTARVAQGLAGAGILATSLGMIGVAVPDGPARTRATALWGAALGAGIAAGPLAAAVLTARLGWRAAHVGEALLALTVLLATRWLAGRPRPAPDGQTRWEPSPR